MSHNLTFVGRENGVQGSATIPGGTRSGDVEISLGEKTYKGTWVYVADGGSVGFGSGTAFSGTASASVTATALAMSTAGGGTILASSGDGSTLRCQFSYNQMGQTGVGLCEDNHKALYDLQIH
jgi:hypothetical protein